MVGIRKWLGPNRSLQITAEQSPMDAVSGVFCWRTCSTKMTMNMLPVAFVFGFVVLTFWRESQRARRNADIR